jgi:aspartyl-tRNA(Asn)/glutamyl-tRNA(Gln) amidotransferase subunit B
VTDGVAAFEAVIGLEIHAQLLTQSKMFCGCSTAFGAPPNTHVCPVCLGMPGALPVANRTAVELAVRAALALNCTVHETSVFARKNYFYPDLPKGYQISQYDRPLATDGALEYTDRGVSHRVGIIRVHLEEDAGKSLHEGFADSDRRTHVDYNRSGVPLIEIVTHPDLRSAADAAASFSRLRAILMTVGVNDGNMEEGSLRCDANVSIRRAGETALGVKAEVKNVNSFRYLQRALEYEIERQIDVVRNGGTVVQETRLWDSGANRTFAMRSKEEAHDYRYFPEPDLAPLQVTAAQVREARAALPELPEARVQRLTRTFGIPEADAALLGQSAAFADYYERVVRASGSPKAAANWIIGDLTRKLKELAVEIDAAPVPADALGELIRMLEQGAISGPTAKDVFEKMAATGRSARAIVDDEGLARIDDEGAIDAAIRRVLEANADTVADYRGGKTKTFGFLVGQVMKATGGKANPALVNARMRQVLDEKA